MAPSSPPGNDRAPGSFTAAWEDGEVPWMEDDIDSLLATFTSNVYNTAPSEGPVSWTEAYSTVAVEERRKPNGPDYVDGTVLGHENRRFDFSLAEGGGDSHRTAARAPPVLVPGWVIVPERPNLPNSRPLRAVVHGRGTLTTRLEIHGTLGTFDHALAVFSFEAHGYQEKYYANLSGIGNESAKQFLEDYAETRRKEGLALISDSILTYSDALYAGYKVTQLINSEDAATPLPAATAATSSSNAAASSSGTRKKKIKNHPDKPKSVIALQRERTKKLTLEDISHCFHLPITDASKELGMCTTALKKICRRYGVTRWPHRKVKSTDGMILKLKENLMTDTGESARKTLMEINKLEDERNRVCEGWVEQIMRAEREIGVLQEKLGASRGVEIHKIVTEIAGLKEKIRKCKLKLDKLRKGKNLMSE